MHSSTYALNDFKVYLLHGWITVLCTSAMHCQADQDEGNIHITQDEVRAIRVLPGYSPRAMGFTIQAMSKAVSMHVQTCKMGIIGVFGLY